MITNRGIRVKLVGVAVTSILSVSAGMAFDIYSDDIIRGDEALVGKKFEDALSLFSRAALSSDPKISLLGKHGVLETLLRSKQLPQARAFASRQIDGNTSSEDMAFLADKLYLCGDVLNAVRAYEKLKASNATTVDRYLDVVLRFATGDSLGFLEAYEKYIEWKGDLNVSPPIPGFEAVYFQTCSRLGRAPKFQRYYHESILKEYEIKDFIDVPSTQMELIRYCNDFSIWLMDDSQGKRDSVWMRFRVLLILQKNSDARKKFLETASDSVKTKRFIDWLNGFEFSIVEWENSDSRNRQTPKIQHK